MMTKRGDDEDTKMCPYLFCIFHPGNLPIAEVNSEREVGEREEWAIAVCVLSLFAPLKLNAQKEEAKRGKLSLAYFATS